MNRSTIHTGGWQHTTYGTTGFGLRSQGITFAHACAGVGHEGLHLHCHHLSPPSHILLPLSPAAAWVQLPGGREESWAWAASSCTHLQPAGVGRSGRGGAGTASSFLALALNMALQSSPQLYFLISHAVLWGSWERCQAPAGAQELPHTHSVADDVPVKPPSLCQTWGRLF